MTVEELLTADLKNHPERQDVSETIAEINGKMSEGWTIWRVNNTMILNKPDTNGDLEFHCYNAERGQNLAANVRTFLDTAKESKFRMAYTPYSNPKINDLFKTIVQPSDLDISEIQNGYLAKVRL